MKSAAVILFVAGILFAVRVMFFGVRRSVGVDEFRTRAWPLSFAGLLGATGVVTYVHAWRGGVVTPLFVVVAAVAGFAGAGAAWWTVRRSIQSVEASPDPEDDPRYRFQGHIARVTQAMLAMGDTGRISFVIDERTLEFTAKWLPGTALSQQSGAVDSEVVVERVEDDVALVEPWALVESRI